MKSNIIHPTIAIDGPAASGKGTLARKIAEILGFAHLDTGLLYRAVAFLVSEQGQDPNDIPAAEKAAESLKALLCPTPDILQNEKLKEEPITQGASKVAAHPGVRNILLQLQKDFAAHPGPGYKGAVLDGRDIGTVICPDAPVKLFITASLEARAERRFKELHNKGVSTTYEAVLRDMRERDTRDAARAAAPMRAADDAVTIDTTDLNQAQALEKALAIVTAKLSA